MRSKILQKLNSQSRGATQDALSQFSWPTSWDDDQWAFTPELLSLHGSSLYEVLDERDRKRLSFLEAVNFFSLNIHGEKSLVSGLSERLYREPTPELVEYLHHFLAEENQHMSVFGAFCLRYAGKIFPNRKLAMPREFSPGEEHFLFFAKVLIFEELVDVYNDTMARDDRVADLVRSINLYHHQDETRHLAFGRLYVRELYDQNVNRWDRATTDRVRIELLRFYHMSWREYFNPDVYREIGLNLSVDRLQGLRESAVARERRWRLSRQVLELFSDLGVVMEARAA